MKRSFIQKIYRLNDIESLEKDLNYLGKDVKYDALTFCNIRLFTSILVFVLVLYISKIGYLLAPFVTILYYYGFYYYNITRRISLRNKRLEHQSLFFFEILTLTLESGRNLENALNVTCDNVSSDISSEFKEALDEMKYGKSLLEALSGIKSRISSDIINNIILNIMQTSEFGNSIIDTLHNEVDFLRDKQILEIKEKINKIPNKVSIISVLFVVPLILVLILGPYIIQFIG